MAVVIALQDVAQFADAAERSVALGNCGTFVSFAGVLRSRRSSSPSGSAGTTSRHDGRPHRDRHGLPDLGVDQPGLPPVLGRAEIMNIPVGTRPAVVHARPACAAPILVDLG